MISILTKKISRIFLVFVIFVWGSIFLITCQPKADSKVVQEIANRIDVDPTWDAIQHYLFISLEPGLSRDEVHSLLDKIGPYTIVLADSPLEKRWDSDSNQYVFREIIRFDEENTFKALFEWSFSYNGDDVLVKGYKVDPY